MVKPFSSSSANGNTSHVFQEINPHNNSNSDNANSSKGINHKRTLISKTFKTEKKMTTAAVGGDVNFENENGAKEEVVVTEGQVSAPFIDSSYPLLQGDNTCSDFSEVSVAKEEGPVSFRFVEEKKEEEEFADCVQERGASKSIGSSSGTNGPVKHSDPSLKSTEQFLKTAVFQSRQRQTEAKGESIAESFPAVSREVVTPKLTERETDKNKEASNHHNQESFGNRYKNGKIPGLSLESPAAINIEPNNSSVISQIEAINQKCLTNKRMSLSSPEMAVQDYHDGGTRNKDRDRRASTGEIVRSRVYPKGSSKNVKAATDVLSTNASPTANTRNLLKMYNKDLYYNNELTHQIDVDPNSSSGKRIDFEKVKTIVEECPSVCRAKYDLTFNDQKRHLYPLFSLVANQAPLDIIRMVFFENPFMFLEVSDNDGQTLMHYACGFQPLPIETLSFLIHRSAHSLVAIDAKKRSPLHTACANPRSEPATIDFLLKQSPLRVVAARDVDGNLPLDLLMQNKQCCSPTLRKSLIARAKENEEDIQQQALVKQRARDTAAMSVDTSMHSPATTPMYMTQVNGVVQLTPSNSNRRQMSPTSARSAELPPPREEIPNPSFWERLCCRPVI